MHRLSAMALATLSTFAASDDWSCPPSGDEVCLVLAPLPGRLVVGVARVCEVVWVIVDVDKPYAREQLLELVNNWPLGDGYTTRPRPAPSDTACLLRPFTAGSATRRAVTVRNR